MQKKPASTKYTCRNAVMLYTIINNYNKDKVHHVTHANVNLYLYICHFDAKRKKISSLMQL